MKSGRDLYGARQELGWSSGLMGRALKLGQWEDPHCHTPKARIYAMESGHKDLTGPVQVAVEAFLEGFRPSHIDWTNIRD